jgi:hypothetical protein
MRAQGGVDPLDAGDDVADPRGDGLAGAFGLVAEAPRAPAKPGGAGQLLHQGVALLPGPRRPVRVRPALGLVDLLLDGRRAAAGQERGRGW